MVGGRSFATRAARAMVIGSTRPRATCKSNELSAQLTERCKALATHLEVASIDKLKTERVEDETDHVDGNDCREIDRKLNV